MRRDRHDALMGSDTAWRIFRKVGKAIGEWQLLGEGDHVLVALSGGKDSFTLLDLLVKWVPRLPFDVRLSAAHVRSAIAVPGRVNDAYLQAFCDERGVPLHFVDDDVVQTAPKGRPSCFHCARRRRIALFRLGNELGTNRLALGHHMDDIVETTLMNMFFNGSFTTMLPRMDIFEGKVAIIRPLALVLESQIETYVTEQGWWRQTCECPFADRSMRARVKTLIQEMEVHFKDVRQNIFASMRNIDGAKPLF